MPFVRSFTQVLMPASAAGLSSSAFVVFANAAVQAEERFELGAGLSVRADRVEKTETALKLYLPSLLTEPLVLSPRLAQAIRANQGARPNAGANMEAAIHGSNTQSDG
jgi:hypothetical protein